MAKRPMTTGHRKRRLERKTGARSASSEADGAGEDVASSDAVSSSRAGGGGATGTGWNDDVEVPGSPSKATIGAACAGTVANTSMSVAVFSASSSATDSMGVGARSLAPTASRNQLPSLPFEPLEVVRDMVVSLRGRIHP